MFNMFINTFVKSQETVVQNSPEDKITTDVAPKALLQLKAQNRDSMSLKTNVVI